MIIFLPEETINKCVDFLSTPHLMRVAMNCLQVSRVLHETDSMTDELRDHPAVVMWRDFQPYLITYGLACIERYNSRKLDPDGLLIGERLNKELDLACTDGYEPNTPPWMGNTMMHQRFKRYLVSESPHLYFGYLDEIGHWDTTLYVDPTR